MSGSDVIVTGMGIICALGEQKETFWNALKGGECGIDIVDLFDVSGYRSSIGGQVRGVDFASRFSPRERRRLGRCDQLGLWAAHEALTEAKITERKLSPHRIAVVMGAGAGGVFEAEHYRRSLYEGKLRIRPSLLMPFPACNLTDAIGNLYGFSGPRSTIATACSSSATAIGYGADLIRSGKADVVVAGGTAPAVLNAANEVAVAAFLERRLGFLGIADLVDRVLQKMEVKPAESLGQLLEVDHQARQIAEQVLDNQV